MITTKKERAEIVLEVFTWALGKGADDVHDISDGVVQEVLAELAAAAHVPHSQEWSMFWSLFENEMAVPAGGEQLGDDLEDDDDAPGVLLVISQYEWECPHCATINKVSEAKPYVYCGECGRKAEAGTIADVW